MFGPGGLDWTSRPVVVEVRAAGELVAVAVGEVVAGTARLGDILVASSRRGTGVGGRLIELFCAQVADIVARHPEAAAYHPEPVL